MSDCLENISIIQADINRFGDGKAIKLIAVSKRKEIEKMKEAVASGIIAIGENRIQEAEQKFQTYSFQGIERHFIGSIQSNKVKKMLKYFDYFHGLESLKVAKIIDSEKSGISCLIQVNVSGEKSKSGISPENLLVFISELQTLKNINLVGLMTIATHTDDENIIRNDFALLRKLKNKIQDQMSNPNQFSELSMGMSGDYKIALEEGATMLRIGTGIFGVRE